VHHVRRESRRFSQPEIDEIDTGTLSGYPQQWPTGKLFSTGATKNPAPFSTPVSVAANCREVGRQKLPDRLLSARIR
jgi:hypothetical protein